MDSKGQWLENDSQFKIAADNESKAPSMCINSGRKNSVNASRNSDMGMRIPSIRAWIEFLSDGRKAYIFQNIDKSISTRDSMHL